MCLFLAVCLTITLNGCIVITVIDTAAGAVVKTVTTVVDWLIPD